MDIGKISSPGGLGLSGTNRASAGETAPANGSAPAAGQTGQSADSAPATSRERLDSAVNGLQKFAQSVRRDLNFSIDESTGDVVVKVIDGESGKVVRQIPSEEALKLAARLDDVRSLMFETRA